MNKRKSHLKKVESIDSLSGRKNLYFNWEVRPKGNSAEVYSANGYSKHMERWKAFQEKKIKYPQEIYGLAQALDHVSELKKSCAKGSEFEIVEVTIVKTVYQIN